MQIMLELRAEAPHLAVQLFFAGVREWGMANIVSERQRLRELLDQPQHVRHCPGNLRNLERMRQAVSKVIAQIRREDLRFAFEPAEAPRMNDAVAVSLVIIPVWMRQFRIFAAAGGLSRKPQVRQRLASKITLRQSQSDPRHAPRLRVRLGP